MLIELLKNMRTELRRSDDLQSRVKYDLITTMIGEIELIATRSKGASLTDADIIAYCKTVCANATTTLNLLADSDDRKQKLQIEVDLLKSLLPTQMSRPELESLIRSFEVCTVQAIMQQLKGAYPGMYNAADAAAIAKQVQNEQTK